MKMSRWLQGAKHVAATATAIALTAIPAASRAALTPASASFVVVPGDSVTEVKTAAVPARPSFADVEIAIDTTGSMYGAIAQAKIDAINIVNGVKALVPDTNFAVVEFKDSFDYVEYQVRQAMTADATLVQNAINPLYASGGDDWPEAYNLVFKNSVDDAAIGWRDGSRKFVIVLGDAPPHGAANFGFPSCSDRSADPHGLRSDVVLAAMKAANRTLFMIDSGGYILDCYKELVAATGGEAIPAGGSLATDIVSLINAGISQIADLHLEVVSSTPAGLASWVTMPPALGPVDPGTTNTFAPLTVTVPAGTASGAYTFDIRAVADGADIGHQALTITVPGKRDATPPTCAVPTAVIAGPPKQVQATVRDTGSGIQSVTPTSLVNATIDVPKFAPGTTDPIVVTFTKIDQSKASSFMIRVTDVAGNFYDCDPVVAAELNPPTAAAPSTGCSQGGAGLMALLGLALAGLRRRR